MDCHRLGETSLVVVYLRSPFSPIIIDEWHVLLKRYRLMECSHGELGSNSHIILEQKQVLRSIERHRNKRTAMLSPF